MVLVPNYRIVFFTRRITESHGVLSRDLSFGPTDQREVICELSNFSSHGESRRVTVFSHEFSFCPELSNLRIGFVTRKVTEYHGWFLSRDLSFGPTDQREVICELVFFTRNVTDGRGGYEGGTIEA